MKRFLWISALLLLMPAWWLKLAAMPKPASSEFTMPLPSQNTPPLVEAIFAGGCFWCMEPPFDQLDGVVATVSGYTGGHTPAPTYKQVSAGDSGHYEAIQVTYDPSKITYAELLSTFWLNIDPFDEGGQFCDRGQQYQSAIFVANDNERRLAKASVARMRDQLQQHRLNPPSQADLATKILPRETFYPAEEYHQDYYKKNPLRYKYYRSRCGRDDRLQTVWGKAK